MIINKQSQKKNIILIICSEISFKNSLKIQLEYQGYIVLIFNKFDIDLNIIENKIPHAIIITEIFSVNDCNSFIQKIKLNHKLRQIPCILYTVSNEIEAGADIYIHNDENISDLLIRLKVLLCLESKKNYIYERINEKKEILLSGYNIDFIENIKKFFPEKDFEIITMQSTQDVFKILHNQIVDCVLINTQISELNGYKICQYIKKSSKLLQIPIVILTGLDNHDSLNKSFYEGADDYISNARDVECVQFCIKTHLKRKQIELESQLLHEKMYTKELEFVKMNLNNELIEIRKNLLQELENKKRELVIINQELKSFTYSVSHDLKAPIRSILGFTEIILDEFGSILSRECKDYFQKIINSSNKINQLIDGLLDFSRAMHKDLLIENVNLSNISTEITNKLKSINPDRNIIFLIEDNVTAKCDEKLFRIVLENLFSNAWKFTEKKQKQIIEFGLEKNNTQNIYFIKDNGTGFNTEYSNKLFKIFQRLHSDSDFKGIGIGLAIVQLILNRHNGRIWAESELDKGSTFYFTIQDK